MSVSLSMWVLLAEEWNLIFVRVDGYVTQLHIAFCNILTSNNDFVFDGLCGLLLKLSLFNTVTDIFF